MVLDGIINATVHVLEVVIHLVLTLFDYSVTAVQEIVRFEQSQPVAVILLVGSLLLVFTLTPFVAPIITGQNFNWNHIIYGKTTYSTTPVDTNIIYAEMTDTEISDLMDDLILVKINPNSSSTRIRGGYETKRIYFGNNNEDINIDFTVTSWESGMIDIDNSAFAFCGSYALNETAIKNKTLWETVIKPKNPALIERLKASVASPKLRLQEVTFSCYGIETLPLEERAIQGTTTKDKRGNLSALIANGSICSDVSLQMMSKELVRPSIQEGYTLPLLLNIGRFFSPITQLLFNYNLSANTPTDPIPCYILASNSTRQRYYSSSPQWLLDTGDSAYLWSWFLYGFRMAIPPRVQLEDWQSIESVQIAIPVEHQDGILTPLQAPYEQAKETTSALTLGMSDEHWHTFENGILFILLIILGLFGLVLVLGTQEIKLR